MIHKTHTAASIVPLAGARDYLGYGPRQAPTLTDQQAAMLARREAERRELMHMMVENQSLGGAQ